LKIAPLPPVHERGWAGLETDLHSDIDAREMAQVGTGHRKRTRHFRGGPVARLMHSSAVMRAMPWMGPLGWALVACGANGGPSAAANGPPGWQPIDPASLPSACGAPLDPAPAPPRPSSLRRGGCDFGETVDFTRYDLNCAPDTSCSPAQTGDQLCHRVCDDGQCAASETCEKRTVYVSDTPSRFASLCMCAGGACAENSSDLSAAEGQLAGWRDEVPMPVDLYYHAAAATDRHLFVSGGLEVKSRSPNGSATSEPKDTVYVADLDADGAVAGWREAGKLAAPIVNHAMVAVGDRLYIAGGQTYAPTGSSGFSDAVVSYPVAPDGSLGASRDEARLPHPRGWHVLLADTGDAGTHPARLIVASGGIDSRYFTDGTTEIAFAEVAAGDGAVTAWSTAAAPAALYYDGAAGIAAGTLFGFVSGEYTDRSSRALYGIRLPDLVSGASPSAFVKNAAWPFDPAALSAVNERFRLAGSCEALVLLGEGGAAATAPVDAAAHVGAFRAAARFFGTSSGSAIAAGHSGRIYATGGSGSAEEGAAVHSSRHL
jgi:hypothetical protein